MPIFPVRGLAEKGILRDPSPYQLDLNAWSAGVNVRFHANVVERAPVWRDVFNLIADQPVFAYGLGPDEGYDSVIVKCIDGRAFQYVSGTSAEITRSQFLNSPVIGVAGTGYAGTEAVTFSAPTLPGGVTTTGHITVSSGHVTGIVYNTIGCGYASAPTIIIAAPSSGTQATATVALSYTPSDANNAETGDFLGDVLYLNRPDQLPEVLLPNTTLLEALPNQECAWTCRSLRAFGDYMIALNVTKPNSFTDPYSGLPQTGGAFPNLFKWSDITLNGQVPDSWDPDDPTKSAGENPLEELNTPIVDGGTLRGMFIIYSENQIWCAIQDDSSDIFQFAKLFDEGGLLAPNCFVEVDGVHYVFGPKDIYKTDGVSKLSIIDKRNKDAVFRNLNKEKSEFCWVMYMPQYNSIIFAYNTADTTATFPATDRANLGAVYDLTADTWSFIDIPNMGPMCQANLDSILTYSNCPSGDEYENIGGSYADQDNTYVKNIVGVSGMVGGVSGVLTANRIVAYDFFDKGSLAFPYLSELNPPAYIERTGIALDQVGSDLTTWKKIGRVYPLVNIYGGAPVEIAIGGASFPDGPVTWNTVVQFDPTQDYKVDGIKGGRYLAISFTVATGDDFDIAGFDLDVRNGGRR